MAVISFGKSEADIFPLQRRLLRLLLERAEQKASDPGDVSVLRQALALDALLLELVEPAQAKRLASAVAAGSREVRDELNPAGHNVEQEFHTVLLQIEARSHRLISGPNKFDVLGN